MSFELGRRPAFLLAEGEPFRPDAALNAEGKPVSVWSAIGYWKENNPEAWRAMAKEVFGLRGKHAELLMGEAVLDRIQETNTCSNATNSVEVWIDAEGEYRLEVWTTDPDAPCGALRAHR